MKLTPTQQKIYDYIVSHRDEYGYPPTVREIAEHLGVSSSSSAQHHLNVMERAGVIKRGKNKKRALEIVVYVRRGV